MAIKQYKGKFGKFHIDAPISKKFKSAFDVGLPFAKELKLTSVGAGKTGLSFRFSDKAHAQKFAKYMQEQGHKTILDQQFSGFNTVTIKENKMNEYYKPKINKEKETITLVNDAELKKAKQQLDKENILYSVSGKIIKFKRSIDFKAAQKFIKENKMNEGKLKNLKVGNTIYHKDWGNKPLKVTKLHNDNKEYNTVDGLAGIEVTDGKNKYDLWLDTETLRKERRAGIKSNNYKKIKENKQQGENKMILKRSELNEMIAEIIKEEENGYQKFFKEKLGNRSLGQMSDEEKKAFFAEVDKEWKGKNETLEPVSPARGNPLKSVKAKKAARILAAETKAETYVRKIVKEELKFVLFSEIPGTTSRKVAKKRIAQTGSTDKSL